MIHRLNVCCLGLALCWVILAQATSYSSGGYYNSYYHIRALEYRVNALSKKFDAALDRLGDVESVLTGEAINVCGSEWRVGGRLNPPCCVCAL